MSEGSWGRPRTSGRFERPSSLPNQDGTPEGLEIPDRSGGSSGDERRKQDRGRNETAGVIFEE